MKEEINLLPPLMITARTKHLYSARLQDLAWRLLLDAGLVLLALVVVGAVQLYMKHLLGARLVEDTQPKSSVESSVRTMNQLVNQFADHVHTYPGWMPLVRQVITSLPSDIRLESLQVNADRDALLIRGISRSRATVIDWQHRLAQLPWVKHLDAPLQNFATGPSINFTFTLSRDLTP